MNAAIPALTINFFEDRKNNKKAVSSLDSCIEERITYIIKTVLKEFNPTVELQTWYFPDANEGEVGSFDDNVFYDEINVVVETGSKLKQAVIALKDGKKIDLIQSIPLYWLTEDFEKELAEGCAAVAQMEAEKKRKAEEKKAAKKSEKLDKETKNQSDRKAFLAIKAKLTPEELQILARHLK